MKLIKLKCTECGRNMFADAVDLEEFGLPYCLFGCHEDKAEVIELGEVEFDDKSKLEGVKLKAISEKLTEVLHELENMGE